MTSHPSHPFIEWPRPLAFALSGGGAFGSVQVGILRALLERGITPDLVVGTSVGALHGALLADQPTTAVDRMAELWGRIDRRTIFGGKRARMSSLLRHRTLATPTRLERLIDEHLDAPVFEDLSIPFAAVVTDALTGEPDIVDSGPLRNALLASAAVPGVFPPIEVNGRLSVDGGVSANVPIRQAIAFGAASVISIDATPATVASAVPRSLSGALLQSMSLMLRNQRSHAVDELAHRYRIAVMPSPTPPDMGTFNFDRTDELLAASYDLAVATLDDWCGRTLTADEPQVSAHDRSKPRPRPAAQ